MQCRRKGQAEDRDQARDAPILPSPHLFSNVRVLGKKLLDAVLVIQRTDKLAVKGKKKKKRNEEKEGLVAGSAATIIANRHGASPHLVLQLFLRFVDEKVHHLKRAKQGV